MLPMLWAQGLTAKSAGPAVERVKIPPNIQEMISEGDRFNFKGNPAEAARKFEAAADMAKTVNSPDFSRPQVQSAALLKLADIHYLQAIKGNDMEELSTALQIYESLPADAAPQQKAQATMNRAALHMKRREPQRAAKLLLDQELFDWSTIDSSQHFLLNYNVGRALAEGQQSVQAIEFYEKSLRLNPRFNLAATKIGDLALSDKSLSSESLDQAVTHLISTKHPQEVTRIGWGFVEGEKEDRQRAIRGLSILLIGWSKSFESSGAFLKTEGERLAKIGNSLIGPGFERDLRSLVQGRLSVDVEALQHGNHRELVGISRVIAESGREQGRLKAAVAQFTFAIADWLATQSAFATDPVDVGNLAQGSLARTIVAFGLDPENTDVPRLLISSLIRLEKLQKNQELEVNLDLVVRELLTRKGALKYKENKTSVDWQNLLKIHMLLAELFQSKKIWTADDRFRSATFHWEEAREDEVELNRLLPDQHQQWHPALHENLAICYAHSARKPDAVSSWLVACEFYLRDDNLEGAARCLQSVQTSEVKLSDEQRQRVADLEKKIQTLDLKLKNRDINF
jgi:tetratricopeptide (TPR) repeat protein